MPRGSSAGAYQRPGPAETCCDFPVQSRRRSISAAGQRPDHHTVSGFQIGEHPSDSVPQAACHAVAVNSIADRPGHDETHARSIGPAGFMSSMNDEVGFDHPDSLLDGGAELR